MKQPPLVTIVMSTYNRADLLPKAIDSIIAQTFTDWELIVIDDCSTDNTRHLMAKYVGMDRRIYYRRNKENIGSGKSKNPVMAKSKGKHIAILDDDDWWKPEYLEKLVALLEQNPDSPLAYCDILRTDGENEWYWDCSKGKPFPNILPSATLMRGDTFRGLGGWDTENFCKGYHAEADYYVRVGGTAKFIHLPESLVHAFFSPSAMSYDRTANVNGLKAMIKKHRKHFSRKELALYYTRVGLHSVEGNLGNRNYFIRAIFAHPGVLEAWAGLILCPSRKLFIFAYGKYRKVMGYSPAQEYR